MSANFVDLLIVLVIAYFIWEALRSGLWIVLADFLAFLFSLVVALRGYQLASTFLRSNFSLTRSLANALGFLITAILAEIVLSFLIARLLRFLPTTILKNKMSRFLAILPAVGESLVLIAFVLTLFMGFPIAPEIKKNISSSVLGSTILTQTSYIESRLHEIFGGVIEDSLTYLTIKPGSDECVPLEIETLVLNVDEKAEKDMFDLVNKERKSGGLGELAWDGKLIAPARVHARNMWEKKCFSHVSPEGEDVGDRLDDHKIKYGFAGENLALAPTTPTAMTGLMNSPGHRANILEKRFRKMGIGVIDNGYYGKMYVQVFTD